MRDPKLIDPASPRIPDDWRRAYLNRPIERLPKDVMVLFDRHEQLSREKNQIQAALIEAQGSLRIAGVKIWALMLVLGAQGAVIGWLVKFVLSRIPLKAGIFLVISCALFCVGCTHQPIRPSIEQIHSVLFRDCEITARQDGKTACEC